MKKNGKYLNRTCPRRRHAPRAGALAVMACIAALPAVVQAGVFGARTETELVASRNIGSGPNTLAVADFNGDGLEDVAINDAGTGGYVRVLLRQADGSLPASSGAAGAETVFLNSGSGEAAAVVAVEVDSALPGRELAVGPTKGGNVRIYSRAGANNWVLRQFIDGGTDATGVDMVAADFTGDGRQDLAALSKEGRLRVYVQQADGMFVRVAKQYIQGGGTAQAYALTTMDVNFDGRLDVVANFATGVIRLPFINLPIFLLPKTMVYRAMINTDNRGNFAQGVENRTQTMSKNPLEWLFDSSIGEALVPMRCPGKPERLLAINYDGTMHILEPENFLRWSTWVDLGNKSVNAVIQDFNGDGLLDAVTINQNFILFKERGSARFYNNVCVNGFASASEGTNFTLAVEANSVRALDVIGNDGKPDLLTVPWKESGALSVLKNEAEWLPPAQYPVYPPAPAPVAPQPAKPSIVGTVVNTVVSTVTSVVNTVTNAVTSVIRWLF